MAAGLRLPPASVHTQVPVHPQFRQTHLFEAASHQLRIMIIQDREEKRGVPSI